MYSKVRLVSWIGIPAIILVLTGCVTGLFALKNHPYIPVDLDDCFAYLDTTLDSATLDTLKIWNEEDLGRAHLGMGMWIRNDWGLWRGSRLAKWFNEQGIWHPDDMSGIILDSYWRHLHNKPIDLESQVKFYVEYWDDWSYPDSLRCPIYKKKLKNFLTAGPGVDADHPDVVTFLLYCPKKHPWFYSRTNGLYAVDENRNGELMARFRQAAH